MPPKRRLYASQECQWLWVVQTTLQRVWGPKFVLLTEYTIQITLDNFLTDISLSPSRTIVHS